jgi:hypothetical protein
MTSLVRQALVKTPIYLSISFEYSYNLNCQEHCIHKKSTYPIECQAEVHTSRKPLHTRTCMSLLRGALSRERKAFWLCQEDLKNIHQNSREYLKPSLESAPTVIVYGEPCCGQSRKKSWRVLVVTRQAAHDFGGPLPDALTKLRYLPSSEGPAQ